MQNEAVHLKEPQDWKEAAAINESCNTDWDKQQDKYNREYDTRVEIVRKRLVKEAGELKLNYPAPGGRDKFDGEDIGRQSHREVQLDHRRVMQQILNKRDKKMRALQEKAHSRDRPEIKLKEQFEQVKDQRQVPDRRAPTRSR